MYKPGDIVYEAEFPCFEKDAPEPEDLVRKLREYVYKKIVVHDGTLCVGTYVYELKEDGHKQDVMYPLKVGDDTKETAIEAIEYAAEDMKGDAERMNGWVDAVCKALEILKEQAKA